MPSGNPLHHPDVPPLTGVTIHAGSTSYEHFIIDQTILIDSALQSRVITNPSASVDAKNRIVYLDEAYHPQVSLISGCGTGHEPSFTGYVGRGMLTATVSGGVLSTPSQEQIEVALSKVEGKHGILAIIMNHQGDVANFKAAISKFNASGIKTELLIVGDDVGQGRIRAQEHGRSGIAGTVLVLKIAGAFAATGATLDEVTRIAKLTASHVISVGSAISHVKIPNQSISDKQSDELLATERFGLETGLGKHQLPGSHKLEVDLPGIVKAMLQELLDWTDEDRSFSEISPGDKLVLLINNLGGLSELELGAITWEIAVQLENKYGIKPERVYSGTFMSTLNEVGFSISLLKVVDLGLANGLDMLKLLDAPAETTAWPATISPSSWKRSKPAPSREDLTVEGIIPRIAIPELDPELPRRV